MNNLRIKSILAGIALLAFIGSSPAFAWQVNEHYHNQTGQDAYDLTKILLGTVNFTDTMMNLPFNDFVMGNLAARPTGA